MGTAYCQARQIEIWPEETASLVLASMERNSNNHRYIRKHVALPCATRSARRVADSSLSCSPVRHVEESHRHQFRPARVSHISLRLHANPEAHDVLVNLSACVLKSRSGCVHAVATLEPMPRCYRRKECPM